ncbi:MULTISPECIES: helix-turn-helix domain-containing protein [Petrimonas]|jgi:two-component system sensor histidine kinase ChiS|uniref:helix-turn-helix domain-containing protein n=1 Tax=Petrimonas TaxID=307628 RepID=UPI000B831ACB|nr:MULTISPECIES: AraC family transcriptional regulator [Petrimonas]MDD3561564.1 AraC family transcriptional regulator [Petrimonas mucosa]HHT30857.1 helix-turn-helix transcriptional regulator [Petrimonas mucosa]
MKTVLKNETRSMRANMYFLQKVTDMINQRISDPDLSPGSIAKELNISVSQLNRKINAASGYSTNAYIIQLRLNHAKKQLIQCDKNIGEIAKICGFADLAYFSRTFKKHTGVTPSYYRNFVLLP